MAARKWTPNWKRLENSILRDHLVYKAHKNYVVSANLFNGNNIPPGVAVTPEINMAHKKRK